MSTELTFTIPKSWWLTANGRYHWAVKARATRNLRQLAATTARGMEPVGTVHVAAYIGYLTGGKADPGNASPTVKALLDGCTDAGLWPDDDHTHVVGPTYLRDPKSPTPGHYTVRLVLQSQEVPW
jgi:crossover junction endodeoxyribonuclease RusA